VGLLADLRDALATTDQLMIFLQPVVDLRSGEAIGAEALVRWRHPRRGLLVPAEFISVVETSELADAFTLYVIDMALRTVAALGPAAEHLAVSVNLCARCTQNADLPDAVAARLKLHGVPAPRLILEITESVMAAGSHQAVAVIAGLRERGVRVCIDDFGTGSASLAFLTGCPVDLLKIDRAFIAAMAGSPETAAIVRTTVDLARNLGLDVIAEGVEDEEQRAVLLALGVLAAQGFLFHPPLPVLEFATSVGR
jgi:EAL domain-containing protein (putative c-di-GMP-specific phosphodiesterase class I)